MINELEKRIYIRFIKDKNLYCDRFKNIINDEKANSSIFFCLFDKVLTWSRTEEGKHYWYKIQLDFIEYLINIKYTNKEACITIKLMIAYYHRLLIGFCCDECYNEPYYIYHKESYDNIMKIFIGK